MIKEIKTQVEKVEKEVYCDICGEKLDDYYPKPHCHMCGRDLCYKHVRYEDNTYDSAEYYCKDCWDAGEDYRKLQDKLDKEYIAWVEKCKKFRNVKK